MNNLTYCRRHEILLHFVTMTFEIKAPSEIRVETEPKILQLIT